SQAENLRSNQIAFGNQKHFWFRFRFCHLFEFRCLKRVLLNLNIVSSYFLLLVSVKYIFIKKPYTNPPNIIMTKFMAKYCRDNIHPCNTAKATPTIRNIKNPNKSPVLIHLLPKKCCFIVLLF